MFSSVFCLCFNDLWDKLSTGCFVSLLGIKSQLSYECWLILGVLWISFSLRKIFLDRNPLSYILVNVALWVMVRHRQECQ